MKKNPAGLGALGVVVMLMLSGCTSGDSRPVAAQPPTSSSPVVSSPSSQEPSSSQSPVVAEPTLVEAGWKSVLRVENPDTDFAVKTYGDTAMVTQTVTADGEVSLTHTTADGKVSTLERGNQRLVQETTLWGGDVLIFASIEGGLEPPYQVEVWTPGEKTARVLAATEGSEWLTEAVVAGDALYFITRDDTDAMCLFRGVRSGDDIERHQITCLKDDEAGLSWLFADGSTVSWMTTDFRIAPNQDEFRCNKLYRLVDGSDVPEAVPGADCVMRGLASANTAVWSDMETPDEDGALSYTENQMHATIAEVTGDAGIGSTGSEKTCGGMVFWASEHAGSGIDYELENFRTWDPEHGVRMLSQPPGIDITRGTFDKLVCVNDTTIGVERVMVGQHRQVEYFIADISTLKAS